MADYVDIETARDAPGLRVVLTRMPGAPWTEAAKAVLEVKRIPHLRVAQLTGRTDDALRAWTGIVNAPIAVHDDERPRAGWREILHLAERLAPEPRLIPEDPELRLQCLGLAGELLDEDGLVWCRRLLMLQAGEAPDSPMAGFLALRGRDYGYTSEDVARASVRVRAVLGLFAAQLERQQAAGSAFLVGDALSAVDLYWATAAAILSPLPPAQCPMPDVLRHAYDTYPTEIRDALDPALLAHRDRIYAEFLTLPIDS